jgi:hypothetical protein
VIVYIALDMISTRKAGWDKAELSSKQLGHSGVEGFEVNPKKSAGVRKLRY